MNASHSRLGIEFISVLGMPPVDFVQLAAELGCQHIGLALQPMFAENPHGYPAWSLRTDAKLRRDTTIALRDCGVSISLGEGFLLRPQTDLTAFAADLDAMQELGAQCVNILSIDADVARTADQCARFAEMAGARSMRATIEYLPGLAVGNLTTAIQVVRHANSATFGVLIDAMHFFRSGSKPAELAAVDPALIGYLQLCDVPWTSKLEYAYEARLERLPPGEGELPLQALVDAAPPEVVVGLEIPMLAAATAGVAPKERLSGAVTATRELLRRADTARRR